MIYHSVYLLSSTQYLLQISMNVHLTSTTVTLMLPVPTLMETSAAPVTKDTVEMESFVLVCGAYH